MGFAFIDNSPLLRSVVAIAAVAMWFGLGPEWPGVATELVCYGTAEPARVFPDINTCAAQPQDGCYCTVQQNRFARLYYLVLAPAVFLGAVWWASPRVARGAASVVGVLWTLLLVPVIVLLAYSAGARIPVLFQSMAVVWPQFVFFGPALYWKAGGPVLPHAWASIVTLLFWLVASGAFGMATRGLRSIGLLLTLAGVFMAAVAMSIRFVLPLAGMRIVLEFP